MKFRVLLPSPRDDAGGAVADDGLEPLDTGPDDADQDGAGSGGAGGAARETVAQASARYLAGLSAEQRDAPLRGPDDELGDDEGDAAPEGATQRITREDGATFNAEAGRWQNAAGDFVRGAPPAGFKPVPGTPAAAAATAAPKPKPGTPAAAAAVGDEAKPAATVVLPGHAERGEEDLEISLDDPEVAERVKRLLNDGMRKKEFDEAKSALDSRQAAIDEFEGGMLELRANPVGFMLEQLTPARQLDVARALLTQNWDALQPVIDELTDPDARLRTYRETQQQAREAATAVANERRIVAHVKACLTAADALVPEGTDAATRREFAGDVRVILQRAAAAGQDVTPQTVPGLLASRVKLYAFDKPAAAPAPAKADPNAVREARPVSDRARAVAAAAPNKATAQAAQSRTRQVQTARAAATRVAPVGAGTAPVNRPAIDPKADIKTATKQLRQAGALTDSWVPAAST